MQGTTASTDLSPRVRSSHALPRVPSLRAGLAPLCLALASALLVPGAASAVLAPRAASAEEIRAVNDRFDEKVESITLEGGRAVLKTASRSIPLDQVKQIRFDERTAVDLGGAKIVLLNGDEVRGSVTAALPGGAGFKLKTASIGEVGVNFEALAAVLFDVPAESERKLSSKLLGWVHEPGFKGRPDKDTVSIRAGGKADGTITELSSDGLQLDAGKPLGVLPFKLKDLEIAVLGNAGGGAPPALKGTVVRVRCTDGSVLSGSLKRLEGGKLELEGNPLGGGGSVTIQVKDVVELFVLNGAFVYLSDLDPSKVEEKFPEGFERDAVLYGWKRDKEVFLGDHLRLGGRSYDKGLGVHTYSSLTYALGGAYKKLRCVVGLDDTTKYLGNPGVGAVNFRVLVDGKPAKECPEGVRKQKGEAPSEIEVDVQGAKDLTLVADYGGFMHVLGRADWADAHLVK